MHFGKRLRQERLHRHLSQEALAEALALSARSIRRWERGQAFPQASVRLQLSRFLGLHPQELFEDQEVETSSMPLWCVPFPRNPFFTGREALLMTLHTSLYIHEDVAFRHIYALHGLGGVGKTQLALEYVYRFAQDYRAVFWIDAETTESINVSLLRIAAVLQLPNRESKDQQRVISAVTAWLTIHDQWLLICDNVEDLNVLDRFLPSIQHGAVLFTTCLQALGTRARSIPVLPMEHEEGMLFLLRRARVLEAEAIGEHMHQFSMQQPSQYAAAGELVTLTGGLPLALDQAGAYLEETQCGLSAYLELFRTRRSTLLQQQREGEGAQDHPMSVATTFTLAITATTECHPAVLDLLRVCALLHPDALPEELFLEGGRLLGATLETVCRDPLEWHRVVAIACSYSLLSRQSETRTFSIHPLVRAVLLDSMPEDVRQVWTQRIVEALDVVFPEKCPSKEYASWCLQCERLVKHALLCVSQAQATERSLPLTSLVYKVAQYMHEYAQSGEAEPLYQQQTMQIREQLLSIQAPLVAELFNRLASLFCDQGRYVEAEPLYQCVLQYQEMVTNTPFLMYAPTDKGIGCTAYPLLPDAKAAGATFLIMLSEPLTSALMSVPN
ncbi:helix-turn-helix domain-containing protein [Ktedonospora formicarum]|uniref:HTH cro/C1-type domain-containing protein n=1 Tax=Ktedonospora formicarum TaxID=2778364 RepID=A0A8J3MVB2_9CHLR|nr:helix-turn-helix domain-containing protein [Ktedonospora formicarum]GHO47488.1 hypothetical protein KSX_56510 [Ktedonospora formicarum]